MKVNFKEKILKSIKNITFEILAFLTLFLSLEILKKPLNSTGWIFGVGLVYLGNYVLVEIFQNIFKVEKKNNIIPILLKFLVPFYTLKVINSELYKRNIYYILGIFLSVLVIALLEYKYKKKYYTKKIFTFENLENMCIAIFPFYFLKTGSIKIIYILLFLLVRKVYMKKGMKIKKEIKVTYVLLILLSLVLIITSILNPIEYKGIAALKNIFLWIFYIFIFFQFVEDRIDYNSIFLVGTMSLTIFYAPLFINWMSLNYKLEGVRLGTFIDITQTGVILGLLSILFLFYICYRKEIELVPYLIINFIFLLLTGSKGPFLLTIFFSILVIYIFIETNKILYVVLSMLLALLLYNSNITAIERLKSDAGSTAARKLLYKESFEQFLNKPILGNGQGTYLEIAKEKSKTKLEKIMNNSNQRVENVGAYEAYEVLWYTHSNPLELLRGSGIFSFAFYYSFISYIIFLLYKYYKKSTDKLCLLGLFSLLYFEIYGLIDNVIIYERLQLISFYIIFLSLNRVFKYDKL